MMMVNVETLIWCLIGSMVFMTLIGFVFGYAIGREVVLNALGDQGAK